jgi:hypothetical protein
MRNRFGEVGVIAPIALLVGAVGPAFGSSDAVSATSDDSDGQTIRAVFLPTDFAEIDAGDQGFSLGDEVVFSGPLRESGVEVGRASVICTFVLATATREEAQCPGTAVLPGGQITVGGVIVNRSVNFTLPITGGSGGLQEAAGQLVSQDASTAMQPKLIFTFHLED